MKETEQKTSTAQLNESRKMRFSRLAHAILSVKTAIWIWWLLGMGLKKSRRVRTASESDQGEMEV